MFVRNNTITPLGREQEEAAERECGVIVTQQYRAFVRHFKAGKLKVMKIMLLEMAHI